MRDVSRSFDGHRRGDEVVGRWHHVIFPNSHFEDSIWSKVDRKSMFKSEDRIRLKYPMATSDMPSTWEIVRLR